MIGHMRHGSPPRLLVLQSILSPNRRESLPAPSAGVRITPPSLSYLATPRRYDAEDELRTLTSELERRVAERTHGLEASNAKLEAANQKLSKLLAERNMLLSEVNHRAKNSLAVAASLLAIQGRRQ